MTDAPAATTRPVLVLYTPADEPFVRGYLVPALGPAAHGAGVVDARDLSTLVITELEDALGKGGAAIAVITPAFLSNPWSRFSELLASRAAIDRDLDVIPLVLEDCALPLHLEAKIRLDFRSRGDWDREAARLRDFLARPPPTEAPLPCPYPGMRPFQAADAGYFHGRDAEIAQVVALVTAGEREIWLIGPSGSGKSSLIAAGVLPRLAAAPGAAELVVRTMRPGDAPLRRLADCLEVGPAAPDEAAVAAWTAHHPGARLVVFIDQLEELFTLASRGEQDRFAAALGVLRAEPMFLLVLALRADFYAQLLDSPLWQGGRRHVDLAPLRGPALRAAIALPARALDVYVEPGLIERLLADAAGEPGVLPLLQETLVQLWEHRRRRLLTLPAYEALGEGGRSGLAVAISSRADRCLAEMTPERAVIARRLLLRLVSFGEGRPNTRRRQTRTQLAAGEPAAELDAVLRQLVAARLVIVGGDGDDRAGDEQVDLCHEVLITAWPPFAAWVEARRADEQRRRQIQASAEEWIARGRGPSGLLDDGELAAAIAWRRTDAARELGESPAVTSLVAASRDAIARARWRWRRRIAAVCAGLVAFSVVTATLAVIARQQTGVAEAQRRQAELARQHAVRLLGEQYREAGRQAVVEGHFQRAIPYLVAAREQGVYDAGLQMLFRTATASSVEHSLRHAGPVTAAQFSGDGSRIVTASLDGTARVWTAASGAPLTPPLVHPRAVQGAVISADGARVVTIGDDDTARIWSVTPHPPPPIALHHAAQVNTAVFSADGAVVVTASNDRTVRMWNARTGEPVGPPLAHDAPVLSAVISRDGSRIVTTVGHGLSAAIWNTGTGVALAPLTQNPWTTDDVTASKAHLSLVESAAFSADGARVVTSGTDSLALVWDAATGRPVTPPLSHDAWVRQAAFSPDGARIATVTREGRVRIWDAATGAPVGPALDALAQVLHVAYNRDGTRILAQCTDKVVRIWDVASGGVVAALELESGALAAAISPDGARVVTASADGLARVWSVRTLGARVLDTGARRGPRFWDATYSPDGARIATANNNGDLRLWFASGTLERAWHVPLGTINAVFDASGRRLAAIALDGESAIGEIGASAMRVLHRDAEAPAPAQAGSPPGGRPDGTPGAPAGAEPDGPESSGAGESREVLIGHAPARGSFSPDGRRFATTSDDRSVRVWDTASGQAVTPPMRHGALVVMVRWSPDGRRILSASDDGTARLWDAATGAPIGPSLTHPPGSWVNGAVFSPDGTRIATVSDDDCVRVWDAASSRLLTVLTGHGAWITAAAFSRDGALLLTHGDDHTARIWDLATGKLAVAPLEHAERVESAAFSPDGARVVTSCDKLVQVWDVPTGRPLAPALAHPGTVHTAVFSPDGNTVLTVADDAVRVWDAALDPGTLEDWHRVARDGSFPQLAEVLSRLAPAGPELR